MKKWIGFLACTVCLFLFNAPVHPAHISYLPGANFEYYWDVQATASTVSRSPSAPGGFQSDNVQGETLGPITESLLFSPINTNSNFQSPLLDPYAFASASVDGNFNQSVNSGAVSTQAGTLAGHSSTLDPTINPNFGEGQSIVSAIMSIPLKVLPGVGETSWDFLLNYDVLIDPGDILGFGGSLLEDTVWEISLYDQFSSFQLSAGSALGSPLTGTLSASNIPFSFGEFIGELQIVAQSEAYSQSSMTFVSDDTDGTQTKFTILDQSGPDNDTSLASIGFNFDVTGNVSPPQPIPEPSSLLLMGSGLLLMGGYVWRRERAKQA